MDRASIGTFFARMIGFWRWGLLAAALVLLFALAPGLASLSPGESEPEESGAHPEAVTWEAEGTTDSNWIDTFDAGFGKDGAEPLRMGSKNRLDCLIEPSDEIEIRSPVIGRIETINVDRADAVVAGQVLVRLESDVEAAAVDIAQARASMRSNLDLQRARQDLGERRKSRAQRLFASNALSLDLQEEVVTEAEVARLEAVEARDQQQLAGLELKRATATLERRIIESPISGVVIERLMSAGEVVDEDIIMRLAQIDPLRVEVILPADQFGSIAAGSKAAVTPEIPGDEVHIAEVTAVDRVIDAASGTFGVRLNLPNPDFAIPGGLPCEIEFVDAHASLE